jgi:hypothetical protein
MWYLIVSFFLLLFLLGRNKNINPAEDLAVTILIFVGLIGFIPFLLKEYLKVDYGNFSKYLFFFLTALFLFFYKRAGLYLKNLKAFMASKRWSWFEVVFITFSILLILRGLYMPVAGWDAYAMYDGRAKYLLSGMNFSELKEFNRYEDTNYLYYFGYPPMTSIAHLTLYLSDFSSPMVLYSLLYVSFTIFSYLILDNLVLRKPAKKIFFLTAVASPLILEQATIAYTNLPMIALLVGALYFLIKFSSRKGFRELVLFALLLAFSNWTRILEPLYFALLTPFVFVVFLDRKFSLGRKFFYLMVVALVVLAPRIVWQQYVTSRVGGIGDTMPPAGTIISRLPNSLLLANLTEVAFFIYIALRPVRLYLALLILSLSLLFLYINKVKGGVLIIVSVIILLGSIMFVGTLYMSVTFDWWDEIPGSFLRSSLVIIPFISFLAAYTYEGLIEKSGHEKK